MTTELKWQHPKHLFAPGYLNIYILSDYCICLKLVSSFTNDNHKMRVHLIYAFYTIYTPQCAYCISFKEFFLMHERLQQILCYFVLIYYSEKFKLDKVQYLYLLRKKPAFHHSISLKRDFFEKSFVAVKKTIIYYYLLIYDVSRI